MDGKTVPTVPTVQEQLRQELLDRGKKHKNAARWYLFSVAGVLLMGLAGIVFAAYLSRLDQELQQTDTTRALIAAKQEELNALPARFPTPVERAPHRVELTNDGRGVAVGEEGTVLTTNDAGRTWTEQDSGTMVSLFDIALTDDGRGIAVGEEGTVLTTHDAGMTWTWQDSGTVVSLLGIALTDDGRGIAVGEEGTVLTTHDAGMTWTWQDSGAVVSLLGIALTDDGRGIAVGRDGTVLTTHDAGMTWAKQDSRTMAPLFDIALTDDGRGIAVGMNGTILTTHDAGMTWDRQDSGATVYLLGIALANNGRGIAVGMNGTILTTHDAGMTWAKQDSGATAPLSGIALTDSGRGIAVGMIIGITTSDSGMTWTKRISSAREFRAKRATLLQEIRDLEVGRIGRAERPPGSLRQIPEAREESPRQIPEAREESPRQIPEAREELMRTGPIRLGIVVLLLFLVQVLVGLNRYNTRLAAFYLARADTLLLLSNATDPIPLDAVERLTQTLSPDQLDFGRTPKAVAQHAVDLARSLSTSRRS